MLKIRLRKPGKSIKRRYHFKIVVTEARSPRESRFVEELGVYDPSHELLKLDMEKYQKWVEKGAQPTDTVASLFKKRRKQAAAPEAKAVKAEPPKKEVAEAKVEEQKVPKTEEEN